MKIIATVPPPLQEPLTHPKYRADIDGLRAIAVLSVVGFHAFPESIRGGFIGVDIFFVISGFLISTIIFENLDRHSFSFAEFYIRRIKRIFPALLVVLIATFAFGWFALLSDEFKQLGKHIAGGAGFVSNMVLWSESGYFDNAAETKPFLHLWSLGIEEQFYIVWPLMLWIAWKQRLNLLIITIVVISISFSLNIWKISSDVVAAFYAPQSRFWELLIGSCLAHLTSQERNALKRFQFHIESKNLQSFFGITLLAVSVMLITKERAFPGWWAVLPTIGAALIISAGPRAWINRKVLSNRTLVWFGLISFPLYLWHWPLLAFARIVGGGAPSLFIRLVGVATSIALAWLTFALVEKPIRSGGNSKAKATVLSALMLLVFTGGLLAQKNVLQARIADPDIQEIITASNDWEYPGLLRVYKHLGQDFYHIAGHNQEVTFLWGDSHMEQYGPRVLQTVTNASGSSNSVLFATSGGCLPVPNVYQGSNCAAFQRAALDFIKRDLVKVVIIGGCWNCYFSKSGFQLRNTPNSDGVYFEKFGVKENFLYGRGKELAMLELEAILIQISRDKKVFLLLDNPISGDNDPLTFLSGTRLGKLRLKEISQEIEVPTEQLSIRERLINISKRIGIETIDPLKKLCKGVLCLRTTDEGVPIYKDSNHLRPFFVREQAEFADSALIGR